MTQGKELMTAKRSELINNLIPEIFNFDYPIWDESHRITLEYRIINHYWIHEIGFETIEMFQWALENWLNEHMDYYIALWEKQQQVGNPFRINSWSHDKLDTDNVHDRKNTGTQQHKVDNDRTKKNTGTQTNEQDAWQSDRDIGTGENYKDDDYVTFSNKNEGTSTRTDNLTDHTVDDNKAVRTDDLEENLTEKDDETRVITKWQEVADKVGILDKFARTYRDIDDMIIKEIQGFWMMIW